MYGNETVLYPKRTTTRIIIWHKPVHNFNEYHSLGKQIVTQVGDFVLLSDLGVGGTILKVSGNSILLENSYLLNKNADNSSENSQSRKLKKFAQEYARKTKENLQRDLLEGELSAHFIKQSKLWASMTRVVCSLQAEITRLQISVTRDTPEYLSDTLYGSRGIRAEILGDAYRLGKCKEIQSYDIVWSRKLNNTCFLLFPVILENNTPRFLELVSRTIFNSSHTIESPKENTPLYVRDRHRD